MNNTLIYITCFAVAFAGCSEDKESKMDVDPAMQKVMVVSGREKAEIPGNAKVYRAFSGDEIKSLDELEVLYKEDAAMALGQDYEANLKNEWLVMINKRLLPEGNETQRVYFINEQLAMENNLPHIKSFYKLLASAKSLSTNRKVQFSKKFYDKNLKVIQGIEWHTPAGKKDKETELLMAWRNFAMQIETSK